MLRIRPLLPKHHLKHNRRRNRTVTKDAYREQELKMPTEKPGTSLRDQLQELVCGFPVK